MLFDNSDCTGTDPTLSPEETDTLNFIRGGEEHVGCRINTATPPTEDMWQVIAHFAEISDLPAPDHVGGYACWGYRGPAFELHAGASRNSPIVGTAQPGQSVVTMYYSYYPDWQFYDIATGPGGETITSGWASDIDIGDANCDLVAG